MREPAAFVRMPPPEPFWEAALKKGLSHAKAQGCRAWIMDASQAKGAFPQDVQQLIANEVLKAFVAAGIKYFVTIKSDSAVTNMAIGRYAAHLGRHGIKLVEVPEVKSGITWLANN